MINTRVTRRRFAITTGCALASVAFSEACRVSTKTAEDYDGRLTARPAADAATSDRKSVV